MAADIEPLELAQLVDFAERPRTDDWSLRAALVRYAQPEAQRVESVLQLVRRIDSALGQHGAALKKEGRELWAALERDPSDADGVVGVLQAAQAMDRLGDVLATWAVDYADDRPNAEVDRVVADVEERLANLGVPHEERPPGPRNRG